MQVPEFRQKIKPQMKVRIGNREFPVREVVKFRFDDGTFYIKCFLSGGYVLADDLKENIFLLVKEVKTAVPEPFPPELKFQGKQLKFLYTAHAVAEDIQGEEIFKKGESERFWDYQGRDGSYLSLGVNDQTKERLDFAGRVVKPAELNILTEK